MKLSQSIELFVTKYCHQSEVYPASGFRTVHRESRRQRRLNSAATNPFDVIDTVIDREEIGKRFFFYKIQTPVTRGWILEYAGGGAACTQPTCGLGVVAQAVHQRNRGFTDEGRVETKETKKEEGQRKWEVWKFVGVLKVLKMDYHSVVGSGNYWVTFVAQSQFVPN